LERRAALTQKEIEKSLRTGNAPIKSILQQQLGEALKRSNNTEEFIHQLRSRDIRPKFNISKTTGRVSGISFRYEGIIYKGSSLGRKYSWNNIIKQIDYEQIRDRTVILENNYPEQGNKGAVAQDTGSSFEGGTIQISEKPKYDLGGTQKDGLDDDPFTPFKMELEDFDRWKRRKKRKRKKR